MLPRFRPSIAETRIEEESRRLGRLSVATLDYMRDYGLAKEYWLKHHRGDLLFRADCEHDLFEAMRLSARLRSVDRNVSSTGRANEAIRAELVRRELDDG